MELPIEDDISSYIYGITRLTARCMVAASAVALIINGAWFFFDDFFKTLIQEILLLAALIFSLVSHRLSRRGSALGVLRGYGLFGILLGAAIVWTSGDTYVFTGYFVLSVASLVAIFAFQRKEALFWCFGGFLAGLTGLYLRYRLNLFGSGHSFNELLYLAVFHNLIMGALLFLGMSIATMFKNVIIHTNRQKKQIEICAEELGSINARLYHSSTTDPLTGLNNRLKLDEVLQAEKERGDRYKVPFALILFDLDLFKDINDTHGHQVGDEVLKNVAALIKESVRRADTEGRWGGEEFLVICPETELESAMVLAEKIRQRIAHFSFTEDVHLSASFGVSQYIPEERIADVLFRADSAMYLAKAAGRNQTKALRGDGEEQRLESDHVPSV